MMALYPDLAYLEANIDHPLKDISYLKRASDFGGVIFYHKMDGEFINARQYIDGTAYVLHPTEQVSLLRRQVEEAYS